MASKYDNRKPLFVLLCCVIISGVTAIEDLAITHPPQDAYALRDAPLLLDCGTASQPPIVVIWRRNGQEINLDGVRSVLGNGSLLIDSVLPKKDAGIYQCCASNDVGTICSTRVNVTIAILPRFDVHPEPNNVTFGGTARFVCHTQAAPPPEISWKHDRRTIDPTTDTRVTVLPGGVLQIVNVTPEYAGDYRCIAENIADKRRSQPAALVVRPRVGGGRQNNNDIPQIVAGPSSLYKVSGEGAVFECLVDAGDESTLDVSWSRQDGNAISQAVTYTGRKNLHFNSVTTSDAGIYICTATNTTTGSSVQASAKLTVYVPPKIVTAPIDRLQMKVAQNARFSCEARGVSDPNIRWVHNGWDVHGATGRYTVQRNNDLIIASRPEDSGIVQCVAENEAGVQTADAQLSVGDYVDIPSPSNIRVIPMDSTTILVTWNPPETKSPPPTKSPQDVIIAYSVHYQKPGDIEIQQIVGGDVFSYEVLELEPFTDYAFYLQCWTGPGAGPPSELNWGKTYEAPPIRAPVFTLSSDNPDTVTIKWEPLPKSERNGIVTHYKILWNLQDGDPGAETEEEISGELVEYTIVNLQADTWYEVRMAAKTLQYGPFSELVSVKTWPISPGPNVTTPRAPRMELSTPSPTSILVNLALPSVGSPITGYKVYYKHKGARADEGFVDLRPMMPNHEFTGLAYVLEMASRRKIEPEGDTPGKPPEKKASAQKNKGSKKRLAFTSQEKDVENDRTWLPQEKKTLIQFYVDKHINNWPTHRHYPTSDPPDTYSMCAEYVNSVWGKARTGGACRGVIQRFLQFKDTETPDLAWEKFNIPEPTVMNLFQKLAEEEKLQALDAMFKLTLEDSNMSNYSPANLPSLSLLAMNNLMSAERPNTIANLLTALTGTFDNGKPRMSIDRMPYPLIETNLQFFASNHFNQVKFHPTYHQWLQTMYAHFGGKFTALFNGPMWKVEKENDDSHRQVLEKAFNPSSSSSSPTTPSTPSTGSTSQPPPLRPASTPSTSSHSPPMQLTSTPSTSSQPPPSRPASAPSTSSHSPPMQLTSTPSTSNQPPPLRPASAPSTSSHSPPMQLTSTPSTSSQPPPSRPASAPSTSSHSPPMQLTSTPSTSNQPPPFRPASAPSFWTTVDDEMRVAQIEGVSNRDHEKELLEYHGLQGQRTKPKHVYKATQDAMVNVVGLSDRQLRRDFAKTDYTPGPSIQPAILHQAKKTHPHGRWWIKADACDISTGLRESMTGEWTGDVDMGDGKLQQLHSQYKLQLETINRLTISHIHKQLSSLKKEADEIKEGLDKSQKIYDEKCEAGLGQKRKLNYAWHLQGWKDLQKQNQELTTALTSATASGKEDTFADLKMQLAEYTKGLFMKRRKMASHLLIFMISDELRNKKPYAIPVRIMPVASVKDAEIRRLQVELRKVMEGEGMEVVGFVTDGEWNSLRTMGTSRPTSLIQVIMQAKAEAGKMDTPALEKVLKPNIRQDAEDPTHFHISRKTVHEAVPFADLVEMAKDKVNGMEWKQVLQVHHKRIYPYVPKPKPWVPGTSEEKELESMRSIMATYIFRHKVQKYKEQGIDFTQHIYVPELVDVDGFSFDDREDHGHLFKRIVKCARLGQIPDCDISRWMEALSDKDAMLTAKALRGVDAQSVPDAERMFSKSIVNFMQSKGYDTDAKFASIVLSWHKATDGRGLSEDERHQYNMDMLNYILDDWMPFHRSHTDFSQVDINKPIKGIRGLTREVVIGITTNIYSQELRRARLDLSPEHPRASTSDDVEGFIALLHYILGRTFDHKAFVAAYRKIFQEFQKMMDEDLPFLYYQGLKHRYTTDVLPSFNVPSSSGKPERLDRVRGRRLGNIGSSVTSRAAMPRSGQRTSRDSFWRVLEPLPPITDN